jgi:rhodanese-related sulfurtransferase
MPSLNSISPPKLARLIGTPGAPAILDVRTQADFAADARLVPGSVQLSGGDVADWGNAYTGRRAVVICQQGQKLSEGVAAWLRYQGAEAEILEGGAEGWANAKLPMVQSSLLPRRDSQGRSVWVTRARPKVDRIACPWLIRRFVDPNAVFLFVSPSEVAGVAERFGAAPFDIEGDGVVWSHDGDRCTFDVMIDRLGLSTFPALEQLASIVRGADTGRPNLVPEAAGLLAISLGLSRMFADDLDQLETGMPIYDALYRWCRDARGETHDWESHRPREARS